MNVDFSKAVDVRGYAGQYMIFPDGRVWSVRRATSRHWSNSKGETKSTGGKFLSPVRTASGLVVTLASPRRTVMIHSLVAHAFVPGKFEGAFAGFKDRDRDNYHHDNLEWITRAESQRRAVSRPKRVPVPPPPRRSSGALDVWDTIPKGFGDSDPLPWE